MRLALLAALGCLAAGCSMEGQVVVQFSGTSPAIVTETISPDQGPYAVHGVTTKRGQRIGISCAVTMTYDVREATGTAILVQRRVTRLRTRPLRRGTAYSFDCLGALVTELPADAFDLHGVAERDSGGSTELAVSRVASARIGAGRRLRPEIGTQLAVARWPSTTPPGTYDIRLSFSLPTAHAFTQRAIYAAAVSCGHSRYLQPILPAVTSMKRSPAFTIHPSSKPTAVPLPHLAPGIASQAETSRALTCS
jgi:hypothetical protein